MLVGPPIRHRSTLILRGADIAKLFLSLTLFRELLGSFAARLDRLHAEFGITPGLAVIQIGNRHDSNNYINSKRRLIEELRINFVHSRLPEDVSPGFLVSHIQAYNSRSDIHGILLQLPLPASLAPSYRNLLGTIDPLKDVDGLAFGSFPRFHEANVGRLSSRQGTPYFVPCTARGVLLMIKNALGGRPISGLHAVVLGRGDIAGRPTAQLLLNENATVTTCHSKSQNLASIVKMADIVVAAVGRPRLVGASWIKEGAIVIDVGVSLSGSALVGDVCFDEMVGVASAVSPVPGGVGPMTVAMLVDNVIAAAEMASGGQERLFAKI